MRKERKVKDNDDDKESKTERCQSIEIRKKGMEKR